MSANVRGILLLSAVLPVALGVAQAQSFSCEMAHTKDEEAVCRSHWLRRLDRIMADQYLALKKYARQHDVMKWKRLLAQGQQKFVAARAECGDNIDCIGNVYENRIGELVHMWKEMTR